MIDAGWIDRAAAAALSEGMDAAAVMVPPAVYLELLALAKEGLPPETKYAGRKLGAVVRGCIDRWAPDQGALALERAIENEVARWLRAVYGPQLGNAAQKAICAEIRRIVG